MQRSRSTSVQILLVRPPGYEDVHPDLVLEDAMRDGWPCEILEDRGIELLVEIHRIEAYERAARAAVAADAVKATWQEHWRLA
ncbi:hypothetical protein ACQ859_16950 [Roseateles chitinivorans]|uniref:hypothetical protein n=1 Tax=Roseateles chitinivorans TaxID=2917965 RepID=UPI003D67F3A7